MNDPLQFWGAVVGLGATLVACTKYIVGSVTDLAGQIKGLHEGQSALRRDVDRHETVIEKLRDAHEGAGQ